MRDPKRIKIFCDKLADIWENECPDWRFTQLISNVLGDNPFNFYIEDDKIIEIFDKYFNTK